MRLTVLVLFAALWTALGAGEAAKASPPADGFPRSELGLPPDTGAVDVRRVYGAKGDGVSDDTEALQRAIGDHLGYHSAPLYLPEGTYLVSRTLRGLRADGVNSGGLKIFGQHRDRSIIRLKDRCPGFADPATPTPVLRFYSNDAHGGMAGNGNAGHWNSLYNLTIDTGNGNPGAVGTAWLASNVGTLRDVTVRTGDGRGVMGIDMTMAWPGPCLLRNVAVLGFDTGIAIKGPEYGITGYGLHLAGQRVAGLVNDGNQVYLRKVRALNTCPTLVNRSASGQLVVLDGVFRGLAGGVAIENQGLAYLRNCRAEGGNVARGQGPEVSELSVGDGAQQVGPSPAGALKLPMPETPEVPYDPPEQWAVVRSAEEAQAAIDQGRTTICFPFGQYRFRQTVIIRNQVRRIIGMGGNLWSAGAHPCWRFEGTSAPATVMEWMSSHGLELAAPADKALIVRDAESLAVVGNTPECGPLFIEDVCLTDGMRWTFTNPMNVWAYQWNPEDATCNVTAKGVRFWILGFKSEREGVQFDLTGGALELLGGLIYPVYAVPPERPMFILRDTPISLLVRCASYAPGTMHRIKLRHERGGAVQEVTDLGRGLVVDYTAADLAALARLMRGDAGALATSVAATDTDTDSPHAITATRPQAPRRHLKPEALPAWDARLYDRIRQLVGQGKGPRFTISTIKRECLITAADAAGNLTLQTGGAEVDWRWAKLSQGDKLALSLLIRRPFDITDHTNAAFWLFCDGQSDAAERLLDVVGAEAAEAVREAFVVVEAPEAAK
jgi:hypothetical protein